MRSWEDRGEEGGEKGVCRGGRGRGSQGVQLAERAGSRPLAMGRALTRRVQVPLAVVASTARERRRSDLSSLASATDSRKATRGGETCAEGRRCQRPWQRWVEAAVKGEGGVATSSLMQANRSCKSLMQVSRCTSPAAPITNSPVSKISTSTIGSALSGIRSQLSAKATSSFSPPCSPSCRPPPAPSFPPPSSLLSPPHFLYLPPCPLLSFLLPLPPPLFSP